MRFEAAFRSLDRWSSLPAAFSTLVHAVAQHSLKKGECFAKSTIEIDVSIRRGRVSMRALSTSKKWSIFGYMTDAFSCRPSSNFSLEEG